MGKIATTWELMKSSWRVLMQDLRNAIAAA